MRKLDEKRLTWLEETCRDYEMNLLLDERVQTYLSGRGVSTASRDRFRLGLVQDPPAEHKGVVGRLAIPTLKGVGVVGFKFRCIRADCLETGECAGHGKYMTFEQQSMYNVGALDTDRGWLAICEGELDAITLDGECGVPAVALPGINSWDAHGASWERLLRDFERLWIFADNDANKERNVGQEFGSFLAKKLDKARVVQVPSTDGGKSDVNSFFVARGRAAVRDLIGLK